MGPVRARPQRHVSAVAVELPDEGGVVVEGVGRGEGGGVVASPEAAGAAEGGEAGGGGEAGAEEGEDVSGGLEVGGEGLEVGRGDLGWGGGGHSGDDG